MVSIEVLNRENEKVEELELRDDIFNFEERPAQVHQVVRMQLAKKRLGTAYTKSRSEVVGSTKKMFRQKGTGRARRGSAKSPILKGGGVAFGPKPRDFAFPVPKKMRKDALKSAISSRVREGKVFVLDDFSLESYKTKEMVTVLDVLELQGNILIVLHEEDTNVKLSSRNIPYVKVLGIKGINVYDVLRFDNLLFTKEAISKFQESFTK